MTKRLGWVVGLALGLLPGAAHAQSTPMQHTAPPTATAQAVPPAAGTSDVVWLQQRVGQLEAQLAAAGGACPPAAKSNAKSKMKRGMSSGSMGHKSMGDMPMGDKPMGDMPMGDKAMEGDM